MTRAFPGAIVAVLAAVGLLLGAMGPRASFADTEGRTWLTAEEGTQALHMLVDGKSKPYYTFTASDPARVTVNGPAKLTLVVRLVFKPGMGDSSAYVIEVREGSTLIERHPSVTRRSGERFVDRTAGVPGLSRKMSVDVPAGRHLLAVTLVSPAGASACARFSVPGAARGNDYVSIAPVVARDTYTALAAEKQITYYGIDAAHPVTVRVVGPARLRILSRLNFDFALHGERRYMLEITQDGKPLRQDALVTTRSTSVPYTDRPQVIPGKDKVTLIDVPRGTHEYDVRLHPSSEGKSAAVRFTIPTTALGNTGGRTRS